MYSRSYQSLRAGSWRSTKRKANIRMPLKLVDGFTQLTRQRTFFPGSNLFQPKQKCPHVDGNASKSVR